uniref:Protein kinase domain-containing protein n=1 Tax=Parastrongyloides trichosuri TaxID=131310 RepID=A0A0N4ZMF6_PARTI
MIEKDLDDDYSVKTLEQKEKSDSNIEGEWEISGNTKYFPNINGDYIYSHDFKFNNAEYSKNQYFSKAISKNGVKVIKDIQCELKEGLLKGKNEHFCEIAEYGYYKDFCCNILIMRRCSYYIANHNELDNYKDDEIYIFLKHMLSALFFLHNAGFVHGQINDKSFWHIRHDYTTSSISWEGPHNKYGVVLCDLDQVCRWNKNGYLDKLEKQDSDLKKIYEKRIKKKNRNIIYCSIKQHAGGNKSMKGDIESWFYLSISMLDGTLKWDKVLKTEDNAYLEKLNLRKATYSKYNNIGVIFADIINVIDKMKENEIPNIDIIVKQLELSEKYDSQLWNNEEEVKTQIEIPQFVQMALEYRRRNGIFNLKNINKEKELDDIIRENQKMTTTHNITNNNVHMSKEKRRNISIETKVKKKGLFAAFKQKIKSKFFTN